MATCASDASLPLAEKILNLVPSDVGRPIVNIRPHFDFPYLEPALMEAINAVRPFESEVQDREGRWYSLRILPHKTLDNRIDGAVLLLVDIDVLKRSEQRTKVALDYAESVIETVRQPLLVLNSSLQIERANRSFSRVFHVSPAELQGKSIYEIGGGQWNIPQLRTLIEEVLPNGSAFNDFEVEREFERVGHRTVLLNGRPIAGDGGRPHRILLAFDDVTERKELEKRVEERTAMLREMVQEMEAFTYGVSHDLRSPLRAMLGFVELALEEGGDRLGPQVEDYLRRVVSAASRADRLVQDLFDLQPRLSRQPSPGVYRHRESSA